jgi:hypothetical protein
VDWRLGISDDHYKIEDVAIDGVSIVLTDRSEIAAQIARDGGQLQRLLATMRGQAGVMKSNHLVVPNKRTKRIVLFGSSVRSPAARLCRPGLFPSA